jgi:hypothetical protein
MAARTDPLREARGGLLDRVRSGDADAIEAERRRPRGERVLQPLFRGAGLFPRRSRGQKSGSA